MTRKQVLKLILVPVLVGLVAVGGAYAWLEVASPPAQGKQVVAAARAVPAKAVLAAGDLVLKEVPRTLVGVDFLSELDQAVGKVTKVPLLPGELLMRGKLAAPGEGEAGLSSQLPQGRRALTVAADEVKAVAGLVQPGDRVDVIATLAGEVAGAEKSRLLLEDIPVLAVGPRLESGQRVPRGEAPRSITLAVTPEQAVALTLAEERGRIRLALRPLGGEWTRGEIELTTAAFASGRSARLAPPPGPPFALRVAVFAADATSLSSMGLGRDWPPGISARGETVRRAWEGRKEQAVARHDLDAGPGAPAQWRLGASVPVSASGVISWVDYGISLEVWPVSLAPEGWMVSVTAEMRYLDVPSATALASAGGKVYRISEVRPGSERLTSTLLLPAGGCLLIHGVAGASALAAPEGYRRLALPPELPSEAFLRGERELVIVLWLRS